MDLETGTRCVNEARSHVEAIAWVADATSSDTPDEKMVLRKLERG